MQVIGSAEEARALAKGLKVRTQTIADSAKDISIKLSALGGSYRDSGFAELEEIVNSVIKSILSHKIDIINVSNALDHYAEVLERRN